MTAELRLADLHWDVSVEGTEYIEKLNYKRLGVVPVVLKEVARLKYTKGVKGVQYTIWSEPGSQEGRLFTTAEVDEARRVIIDTLVPDPPLEPA